MPLNKQRLNSRNLYQAASIIIENLNLQKKFHTGLLYNYCELITTHVIKQMKNNDKTKQVNFTIAIYICREYLRNKRNLSPPDVINLIEKHVLPVRPGRKDPRKVKPQASVSFPYRVA